MMKKGVTPAITCILALVFVADLAVAQTLYSVSRDDDQLRTVDPATAATTSSVTITLAGESIKGATGLATDPVTGGLFALLKISGPGRELVTINPTTGVATSVGNTGKRFAAIAFDCDGTLYGVTGDGASPPETLFMISTTDATSTQVLTLGNGDDGEALAFNPDDGLLYHASGDTTEIFESIDPGNNAVTGITLSGDTYVEATVLTYKENGVLLLADRGLELFEVTTSGAVSLIAIPDHVSKGLAFDQVNCPPDHFKCYKAKDLKNPKFQQTTVDLADQFGVNDGDFEVKKPFYVCNPTDKNGEGIDNPNAHLACYKIKGPKLDKSDRPNLEVVNQLGTVQLQAKKPFVLCIPSAKTVLP